LKADSTTVEGTCTGKALEKAANGIGYALGYEFPVEVDPLA